MTNPEPINVVSLNIDLAKYPADTTITTTDGRPLNGIARLEVIVDALEDFTVARVHMLAAQRIAGEAILEVVPFTAAAEWSLEEREQVMRMVVELIGRGDGLVATLTAINNQFIAMDVVSRARRAAHPFIERVRAENHMEKRSQAREITRLMDQRTNLILAANALADSIERNDMTGVPDRVCDALAVLRDALEQQTPARMKARTAPPDPTKDPESIFFQPHPEIVAALKKDIARGEYGSGLI